MRQQIPLRQTLINSQIPAIIFISIIAVTGLIQCDRQTASRRISTSVADANGFKSNCGNADQVSQMIGKCAQTMFDVIEGRIAIPKVDDDFLANCNRFNTSGTCIRQVAKDCLTGLHKTSVSSVATATKRIRTVECKTPELRARYREPTTCAVKLSSEIQAAFKNHTAIAQAIRDLPNITAEEKMVKICCMMNDLDKVIEIIMRKDCPSSVPIILNIVHSLTDDARSTLCRNPKCDKALARVVPSQLKQRQNFIEPIMQILFMINVD